MSIHLRSSVMIILTLVLVVCGVMAPAGKTGGFSAAVEDRLVLHNEYGAVIQDVNGQRINYSRDELEAQRREAEVNDPSSQPPVLAVLPPPPIEATWSYATFGSGIGLSNIIVAQNGSAREIYSGGGFDSYWFALRYNETTRDYDQIYVSPYFSPGIGRIKVADVAGTSDKEIVVALEDGHINLYNQATKALISTITTAANGLIGLDVTDVDGDGANELVLCSENHLYVYSGSGVLKWELSGVGGRDLVVGQMDNDSALEIAVTDGHVVDCGTHLAQWTWSFGFGANIGIADIDNDGFQELIVGEYGFIWAYDVDRQLPKWSIQEYVGAMLVADIDNDGHPEILVGQGQWGSVVAYDPVTRTQKGSVQNPEHGVTNIAVGDVDGDGVTDLLFGAGASSSGSDHLYVVNWPTRQIKWQNRHLDGPFIGPEIGDLDGDGRDEIVIITWSSESGYSSGRILVFDALTRRLRAVSAPTMAGGGWTGIHDLKLRDVNGDGKPEILVAASYTYDGVIEIYSLDISNSFTLRWTNSTLPSNASFYSVDAADIDNDGDMDIIGGAGGYIYVYSYNTTNEEWRSLYMRGIPIALGVADVNQDGTKEIIGQVWSGDVYVFDGQSKALETILTGPFTAMRVQNVSGLPSIVLGNSTGELIIYRYSSDSYGQAYKQRLVTYSVDGFTIDSQDRVWIGSGGNSSGPGSLTEVTLGGTVLATYWGYGSTFGLRTAFVPASLLFFTTGTYSIVSFPTCTASLSTTNHTLPSSSGTGVVGVTAGGSCDWGAVSNANWITVTSAGSGTGNGSVGYSVSANLGPARRSTITIAGSTLNVSQAAAGQPQYQGFLDAAGCGIITGWAWDATQGNSTIDIDIFDGSTYITTIPANLFREDIVNAGIGNGFHGFSFTVPFSLKDGQPHNVRAVFPGTTTELANSPRPIVCAGTTASYQGFHDGAGCGTIAGWAWDLNDPNNPINVDIYDGLTLIATVPAIQFRPDLVTAGIGNGFHGFSYTVPASLKDGQPHSIRVRFPGTNIDLGNTPRTIACSGVAPSLQGFLDLANCNVISGWAWDRNDPNSPINVAIFSDGQLIATVLAIQFRQDLVNAGIGNGYHAFSFNVPASLKDGQPHSILVRYSGTSTSLVNTPKTINCSSP